MLTHRTLHNPIPSDLKAQVRRGQQRRHAEHFGAAQQLVAVRVDRPAAARAVERKVGGLFALLGRARLGREARVVILDELESFSVVKHRRFKFEWLASARAEWAEWFPNLYNEMYRRASASVASGEL